MISVIAPCLNEQRHLPAFLNSLANQCPCGKDFELIIIDGGSTDRSRELINSYERVFFWDRGIVKLINTRRNLGFIRNLGAHCARGEILLFTNCDAWLPHCTLHKVQERMKNPRIIALSGRTVPWNGGALCSAAHAGFDLLRWMFNKAGRFSPSGNFLAIRKEAFQAAGGFPEISVNEDGELGSKLNFQSGKRLFERDLWIGHYAKRWNRGAVKTLLFYSYVFGNFSSSLRYILKDIQRRSGEEFNRK